MNKIGILIKPHAHERGLYTTLLNEFKDLGYKVFLEKDITLSDDDIKFLYSESYQIPAGKKALKNYLENKRSTIVLFKISKRNDVEKEIIRLNEIKGKKEKSTGLRYKYRDFTITEEELERQTGNYYKYMMINLFHVFDDLNQINYFIKKYA